MTEPESTSPPAAPPTFGALPLSPEVRKAIDAMGYKHPSPVQLAVFEPAVRGRNLVVQARTGTGKTAAFGLPILDQLVRRSQAQVQALILCPTRELALQVSRELEKIAQFRGTKISAIYGGAPMGKQVEELEGGAQIVVGTPGRVLDHLRRGTLDPSHVRIFVLDEADEMLSMGFARELNAIAETLPKERQGLFFSATIPPDIERLAIAHLKDPEFVTLSSDQVGALEIAHFAYILRPDAEGKRKKIVRVIEVENPESAIVFCNTKEETERLAEALKNQGFDADWLNGDLDQRERERVMQATREGKLRFLVATDVAARGIDISHLTHVINYDFPESAEAYVHRTGRTGRAGKTGTAISLVEPKDIGNLYLLRLSYKIRPLEKQLPTSGELKTRAEQDLVDVFVEAFGSREVHPDDLALARRLLTHADADRIVAGLLRDHLGARAGAGRDPATEAAEARRAKNPPPVAKPAEVEEKPAGRRRGGASQETERAPREKGERRVPQTREARADRRMAIARSDEAARASEAMRGAEARDGRAPRAEGVPGERRGRGSRGRGVPHASFTTWEPPTENDDDQPIFGYQVSDMPVTAPPATSAEDASVPPSDEAGFAQIFVNVGRRDGARAGDFQKLLEEGAGLAREETGRIRIRERMTFVSVKKEALARALAALGGQVIAGRSVVAEPARTRSTM
jgi:ATP-dependent RNA helicase DeaD